MKNTFHCLAFALSVSFMALANAEMKPAQMQLATLALSTEAVRLPALKTDCPEVDFPNRFWRIESKLDELQTQLQDKDTCVKAFIMSFA